MKTTHLLSSNDLVDLITGKVKVGSVEERKAFWQMCTKLTPMMGKDMCDRILERLQGLGYSEDKEETDFRILFEQRIKILRKTTYDCIRMSITMSDLIAWFSESDKMWEALVSDFYPLMTEEERQTMYDLIVKREYENPFLQQQRDMCLAAFDRNNQYRVRYVTNNEKGRKVNLSAVAFKYRNVYFGGWNKPIREYRDKDGFCEIKKITLLEHE